MQINELSLVETYFHITNNNVLCVYIYIYIYIYNSRILNIDMYLITSC